MLFPSWVGGGRLPLQNMWHEQTMPEDMPFSLLPLSQYYALSIFVMLLLSAVVAGLVVRMLRARAWPAALGVLFVHVIATVQSFAVLAGRLGIADGSAGSRELLYFGGMLGGVLAGMLLAQLGCWTASRPAVPLPALSAVPARTWLGYTIASFDPIYGYPPEVGTVLRWVPAVIVAAASVPAAHSLQTPRWRASLSSRSTTSTAPRPTAVWADCRRKAELDHSGSRSGSGAHGSR
ncbi:hypothetical protein V2S04_00070 [Microbacterium sp. OR21]|uniref:hypothetical protein n=1 Tax=Microbacterium sp. OR21 TaxID=3095346 RepID=UPI0039B5FE86